MTKKYLINVDSGAIAAILSKNKTEKCIQLKPGIYRVDISANKSWNGKVENYGYLKVSKEKPYLVVDDIGILNEEKIREENLHKRGTFLNTGGDGPFKVTILVKKVSRLGLDPYKKLLSKAKDFLKKTTYSEESSKQFVSLFMRSTYYEKIAHLLQKKRDEEIQKIINEHAELLSRI